MVLRNDPVELPKDKIWKGRFSLLPCPHCGKVLEAGPMYAADWVWCGLCDKPIHDKYPCNEKCPEYYRGWERFYANQYRDNLSEKLQFDVDARYKPDAIYTR